MCFLYLITCVHLKTLTVYTEDFNGSQQNHYLQILMIMVPVLFL